MPISRYWLTRQRWVDKGICLVSRRLKSLILGSSRVDQLSGGSRMTTEENANYRFWYYYKKIFLKNQISQKAKPGNNILLPKRNKGYSLKDIRYKKTFAEELMVYWPKAVRKPNKKMSKHKSCSIKLSIRFLN